MSFSFSQLDAYSMALDWPWSMCRRMERRSLKTLDKVCKTLVMERPLWMSSLDDHGVLTLDTENVTGFQLMEAGGHMDVVC